MGWLPPTRTISRSCSTRSRSVCVFRLMSPISSRKTVPPSATSNLPFLRYCAPVKAPFSWPNSSLSSSVSVKRAAVDRHHADEAPRAGGVDGARHQFLAGAAFAGDEHGGLGGADGFDGVEDLLHGGALADQFRDAGRLRRRSPAAGRFPLRRAGAQSALFTMCAISSGSSGLVT